jgi:hypothetical protein
MTISLVEYTFDFRALASAPTDIKCIRTLTSTNVDTDMEYVDEIPAPSYDTDALKYAVAINDDGIGGIVTVAWPSTSCTITIYRETTDKQSSAYDDYNQFPADTVENDFDKRTMKSQELEEILGRTLQYPITAPSGSTLPIPVADTFLGWDATGVLLENKTLPDPSVLVKASLAEAVAKTSDTVYMTPYTTGHAMKTIGTLTITTKATIALLEATTITATTISIGSGSVIAIQSKGITVENPTAAENISMFFVDAAKTIEKIICVLTGTVPSVTWGLNHGTSRNAAGTSIVTGTTTDITSGSTITAFADATIPANSHVWLVTTATSGTIDTLGLTVNYRQDI